MITLRGGEIVALRPIAAEDKPLLIDLFERLSDASRYRRFFTHLDELSPAALAYFTEVDHSDREAIIAIEALSGRVLGVARYVRLSEAPDAAEVAAVVVDDWHRRGLGPELMKHLASRAREEGIGRFHALVQADNRDAVALVQETGDCEFRVAGPNLEVEIKLRPIDSVA